MNFFSSSRRRITLSAAALLSVALLAGCAGEDKPAPQMNFPEKQVASTDCGVDSTPAPSSDELSPEDIGAVENKTPNTSLPSAPVEEEKEEVEIPSEKDEEVSAGAETDTPASAPAEGATDCEKTEDEVPVEESPVESDIPVVNKDWKPGKTPVADPAKPVVPREQAPVTTVGGNDNTPKTPATPAPKPSTSPEQPAPAPSVTPAPDKPTQNPTPTPTKTPEPKPVPTKPAAPVAKDFTKLFTEDFSKTAAAGTWKSKNSDSPAYVGKSGVSWFATPNTLDDSMGNAYRPEKIISVKNKELIINPKVVSKAPAGAVITPSADGENVYQTYGKYEFTMKTSGIGDPYRVTAGLYPESDNAQKDGAVLFPDTLLNSSSNLNGYYIYNGKNCIKASGCINQISPLSKFITTKEHKYTIEWTPTRLIYKVDGAVVMNMTSHIPTKEMRFQIAVNSTSLNDIDTAKNKSKVHISDVTIWEHKDTPKPSGDEDKKTTEKE